MGKGHPGRLESRPQAGKPAPQGRLAHKEACPITGTYGTQAEMPGGIIRRAGAGGTEGNG